MKDLFIKDIDGLYEAEIIEKDGMFVCPVCNKPYKQRNSLVKHMNKKDCADYHNLYQNTVHETNGYHIYKYVLAEIAPTSRTSFATFLKSNSYNPVMKFVTFMNYYNMYEHSEMYISWITVHKQSLKYVNQVMSIAVDHDLFEKFKLDNHALGLFDSKTFIDLNYDRFLEDKEFFVRSVEKCKVGVLDILSDDRFDPIMDSLPAGLEERLFSYVEQVVERKKSLKRGRKNI